MKPPVLGLLCGDCGSAMRSVCDECQQREWEAQSHQRSLDLDAEREAQAANAKIPGFTRLQDLLDRDIEVETSTDEEGDFCWSARVEVLGEMCSGSGTDAETALARLRAAIADHLRWVASEAETSVEEAAS